MVLVGIPESARIFAFCQAASAAGYPAPGVYSWAQLLPECQLAEEAEVIRLESPGRNWATEEKLLKLGWAQSDIEDPAGELYTRISPNEVTALGEPAGRIVAMRQWYLGWRAALAGLGEQQATFWNNPKSIAVLFDKESCQRQLEAGGCPMPPSLGTPASFDDLVERMRAKGRTRIFLKACHGSSASGVMALECRRGGFQAFSTTKVTERRGRTTLWNTRPGKLYRELSEIRRVVNAVCRERAQAQVWVPKMGWSGHRIDFRIVTIAGKAAHTVMRMSRTPLTNLQLKNQRGDVEVFAARHPEAFANARAAAETAAACFPDCFTLGVDVALSPSGKAYVLEANAFGDHLPGCMFEGLGTYAYAVKAWRESRRLECPPSGMRSSTPDPKVR